MENKNNMNIVVAVVVCLALAGVLIFISINNKVNMNSNNNTASVNNAASMNNSVEVEVAKAGDIVSMNYTGRLENGTVFDSNVDSRFQHVEPFIFTLGAGQVIPGWDKGIVGMKVGEKKIFTVAPEDAYRESGIPGIIPPNATLIFDVELISIIK